MYIEDEIAALKKEKQAIILAHYYVPDEVQEYADFVGDSLAWPRRLLKRMPKSLSLPVSISWVKAPRC